MSLRPYQQKSIDMLYSWLSSNDGNPCLVLPTGAGKSHIIAELCRDALQNWPETRILMLTHVKELIEQNADKLRKAWPNAPMGIYSAGLGQRNMDAMTFAGIQSVRNKAGVIGHVDLLLIDECHLVSHKQEGGYRLLIDELKQYNPHLRVIGLTATPFRLGHGYIHHGDETIFDDLVEPVHILDLVHDGYLAPLRSKLTDAQLDASGVKRRGGEYIEADLARAVDKDDTNRAVVSEVIRMAGDRRAWLFFCAGVDHAQHVCDELTAQGITSACVTGKTPKKERAEILADFKAGRIRALTNANVLTTGFDHPDIDLIAMLRPTMSPGLYVQMAGRGMRLKSHTDHCLVLDFAGVVQKHGPITDVRAPEKKGRQKEGETEAPVKPCDNCHELVHLSARTCPACGHPFPEPEKAAPRLHNDDIMGLDNKTMAVGSWKWQEHTSRSSGKLMIMVTYYGEALSDAPIKEYLPVLHQGYAGQSAMSKALSMARAAGADIRDAGSVGDLCAIMNDANPPSEIEYRKDGKFYRIMRRKYTPTGTGAGSALAGAST